MAGSRFAAAILLLGGMADRGRRLCHDIALESVSDQIPPPRLRAGRAGRGDGVAAALVAFEKNGRAVFDLGIDRPPRPSAQPGPCTHSALSRSAASGAARSTVLSDAVVP